MHINDETGHSHIHEHVHADGTVHTHEHTHPHDHAHPYDHAHDHSHEAPADMAQVKAILNYMVDHNEHHADELADLLDMLPENARAKLTKAIGTFEAANVELKAVLESLE